MNADGTDVKSLMSNDGQLPSWSPDGTKIAFVSMRDGNSDIFVMNADGSGQTNLTGPNTFFDLNPSWSPDGSKIVFLRQVLPVTGTDIFVMNADGSGQTNLTNNRDFEQSPSYSPDGTKIVFDSLLPCTQIPCVQPSGVNVMNADGSDMIRLSTDQPGDFPGDLFPAWQPIPDATPPTVNCTASPNLLWPPNHTLRPITVTVNVADTGTGPAGFKLVSITSNQADSSSGGDPPNDIQGWTPGTPDTNGQLRAERDKGSRTYTLTYEGRVTAGNTAGCTTQVVVPHDSS